MKYRFLFIVIAFLLFGCRHSPTIPETPAVSFSKDVQPIIVGNCTAAGCHGSVKSRRTKLETYPEIMSIVSSGNALSSRLYQVITGKSFQSIMPPTSSSQGQLTDAQIKVTYLWIMQGAKNN